MVQEYFARSVLMKAIPTESKKTPGVSRDCTSLRRMIGLHRGELLVEINTSK